MTLPDPRHRRRRRDLRPTTSLRRRWTPHRGRRRRRGSRRPQLDLGSSVKRSGRTTLAYRGFANGRARRWGWWPSPAAKAAIQQVGTGPRRRARARRQVPEDIRPRLSSRSAPTPVRPLEFRTGGQIIGASIAHAPHAGINSTWTSSCGAGPPNLPSITAGTIGSGASVSASGDERRRMTTSI